MSPPADEPASKAKPRRRGGPLKWALWGVAGAAGLVGLYAALGFWVAPKVIRSQVVAQVAEKYHRTASIGEVRLNPFTFRLEARDFRLPDADGKPMIGFDALTVDFSLASIWRGGLAFNEIALTAPKVRLVRRADGRLNVQDLIPPKKDEPTRKLMIDHLEVQGGRAEVVDLARREPLAKTFSPIGFTLRDFSTVSDGGSYVLNALSERGEGLAWRGNLGLNPLASRGAFALSRVQVRPLWEIGREAIPFEVTGGVLDLSGSYDFALKGEALRLGVEVDEVKLAQVGLRATGADADWVILPAVTASNIHVDLPKQTVSVGLVEASGPAVTAWTEKGGGLNLARYAPAKSAATPAAQSGAKPAAPWKVALPELRVRGGRIDFEERTAARPVRYVASPLDVTVKGLALPLAAPVQVEAATGIDGGGKLAARGVVALDKVSAELDVEATNLDLVRLQPYVDGAAAVKLLSGAFSAKGKALYRDSGAARFDGSARIDSLHTVDAVLGQDFINWRALRLEGLRVDAKPFAVKIAEVVAQEPYAKVVIGPNYVMNITTVLNPKAAAAQAPPPPPKAKPKLILFKKRPKKAPPPPPPPAPAPAPRQALPVEIALVRIQNGRMDFADLSLNPNFGAGIQSLDGTIKGLSGRQDARASVDLAGEVDRFSPVKIGGQVNYFAVRSFTDVKMSFANMEMTTLTPYSGKFAGYRINKGKLNVDLQYRIDDQKLDANHRVVINQLELGDKVDSAEATKLPVKLAVALLKDRHGVIDIPIAISGTLDDPKFKVWPVIWKVVGNLFTKIVTSPFALLGSLGGGGEDLQFIDFEPGAAALNAAGEAKVTELAKALAERPGLNLEIPMPVNAVVDRPAMVEAKFKALVLAAAPASLGKTAPSPGATEAALARPKSRRKVLEDLYRQQFAAKPEIPKPAAGQEADAAAVAWLEERLRAKVVVTDQELAQLGRARAEAVQAALMKDGQVNATRVFVTNGEQPPATVGPVRMTLALS